MDVLERFDEYNPAIPDGIKVGENGKIWMQGKVLGGFMVAGEPACIELQVKNHSTKKVRPSEEFVEIASDCWTEFIFVCDTEPRTVFAQRARNAETASTNI